MALLPGFFGGDASGRINLLGRGGSDYSAAIAAWALDAERLETWHGFGFWKLNWWYWMASGYGERSLQALIVLIAIWLAFAGF